MQIKTGNDGNVYAVFENESQCDLVNNYSTRYSVGGYMNAILVKDLPEDFFEQELA